MRNSIKLAGLGVGAAAVIAGAFVGLRWFRSRRANEGIDIDLAVDDLDVVDFGDPVVVAEEIVVVPEREPTPFS